MTSLPQTSGPKGLRWQLGHSSGLNGSGWLWMALGNGWEVSWPYIRVCLVTRELTHKWPVTAKPSIRVCSGIQTETTYLDACGGCCSNSRSFIGYLVCHVCSNSGKWGSFSRRSISLSLTVRVASQKQDIYQSISGEAGFLSSSVSVTTVSRT